MKIESPFVEPFLGTQRSFYSQKFSKLKYFGKFWVSLHVLFV